VEAAGVEATGVEATGVEATGEAIGVLPTLLVGPVLELAGGVSATALLASLADPALCVEPLHPASRDTETEHCAQNLGHKFPTSFDLHVHSPR